MNRKTWAIVIGVTVLIWFLLRRSGTVRAGTPVVTGKAGSTCRPGEVFRGGFCATPGYWAELDAIP